MAQSFSDLHQRAAQAGLQRHWRDVDGQDRVVADDALAAILDCLGPAPARRGKAGLPPLIVTEAGLPTPLPLADGQAELTDEAGQGQSLSIADGMLAPIARPGYYDLAAKGAACRIAVAPARCPLPQGRHWGASLQIPSLRGARPSAFGGLGELAEAVDALADAGCGAVAINPVHALLPGVGEGFSPYSPSSRIYLNPAIADPALLGLPPLPPQDGGALIDWPGALPQRLDALRQCFRQADEGVRARFMADDDAALTRHALHDALYCHFGRDWRQWPARYRGPDGAAVRRFAGDQAEEVAFHRFAQWLAREGLAAVQVRARDAGMAIGLIADLAVGVNPGGSDCWAMPEAMLRGLTIGAPPDPLGPLGQNWSITGFSPQGLQGSGYAPFIAMLRAALRSAGALRIDHAFGLSRLWVIPEGGGSLDGAYLSYPFLDLARLVTLEAHRAGAAIIAEDLGTAPPGFTHAVTSRAMLGMRVLWFERAADHGFIGAHDYPADCAAMTGTHDTPTVAGWWRGRDLDWAAQLGRLPAEVSRAKAEEIRDWDRGLLWSTLAGGERPASDDPAPAVEAALAHVARSPAVLALAPVEDLLAEDEQPNLPGTVTEHPNWRRRQSAPLADLLHDPATARRVDAMARSD